MLIAPISVQYPVCRSTLITHVFQCRNSDLKSQWRPTGRVFVYKIQVNPVHTILKYGIYYDFMDSNSAVLKGSSQWQLEEC